MIPTRIFPIGPNPPYDAEIEYLESTGSQYIDTGVVAESNGWVHAKAECADGRCNLKDKDSMEKFISSNFGTATTIQSST